MRVTVATGISEVERLRPLGEELQKQMGATIFQNFDWNLLALRVFLEEKPYFVAVEGGSSAAIVPAVIRDDEIHLAGGPLFDYRDPLCVGNSAACTDALERIAELGLPWKVYGIRSTTLSRWPGAPIQPWTSAPFVSLRDISAEAFAKKHTRSRRSLHRLADLGASVRSLRATAELLEWIYREKAKEPSDYGQNIFRDPRCVDFMRSSATLFETRCEVFLLEISQAPIAALVTFIDNNVRRFYTTWMDQRWSKHSPGIALLYEATRQTLAAGLDCDYMTGEQTYKMRFATGSMPLHKLECSASEVVPWRETEEAKAA